MRRFITLIALVTAVMLLSTSIAFGAVPLNSRHTRVSFADTSNGYLSGFYYKDGVDNPFGYVARTGNGGADWTASSVANQAIWGLGVADASSAWAILKTPQNGSGSLFGFRTLTGGASWPGIAGVFIPENSDDASPLDIAAISSSAALVAGYRRSDPDNGRPAMIWRTSDGGSTWSATYRGPLYQPASEGAEVPDSDAQVLAIGSAGTTAYALVCEYTVSGGLKDENAFRQVKNNYVLKSSDGGSSWTTCSPDPLPIKPNSLKTATLSALSVASPNVAWAAGTTALSNKGQVFRTVNGSTWAATTAETPFPVSGIDAYDANRAVVVGSEGRVALTVDGGASWTLPIPALAGINGNDLQSVSFAGSDPNKAVAVGDDQLIVQLTFGMNGSTPAVTGVTKRSVNGNLTSTTTPPTPPTPPAPTQQVTSLSLSVPAKPSYAKATVSGQLTASGAAVTGRSVVIEKSTNGSTWAAAKTLPTGTSGEFAWAANPTAKTWYRARFAGDSAYKAVTSSAALATPKVSLGTPVAPKTMKKSKYYTVSGSLKPRHMSGTVRIYKEKYVKTKVKGKVKWTWKKYGHVNAKVKATSSTASKYSVKMRLTSKGTWRLRAYAPADAQHSATWSSKYDKVKVK